MTINFASVVNGNMSSFSSKTGVSHQKLTEHLSLRDIMQKRKKKTMNIFSGQKVEATKVHIFAETPFSAVKAMLLARLPFIIRNKYGVITESLDTERVAARFPSTMPEFNH